MVQRSVFFDEWIRSLREQYKHVVRHNDKVTLPTLTAVMQNVGFRENELAQLRVEATMHIDDVGEDFVADLNALQQHPASQAHTAECACPQCVTIDDSQFDHEGQPLPQDPERTDYQAGQVFPVAMLEDADVDESAEVLTFEDTLAARDEIEVDHEESEEAGDEEDDADQPQQISLF